MRALRCPTRLSRRRWNCTVCNCIERNEWWWFWHNVTRLLEILRHRNTAKMVAIF